MGLLMNNSKLRVTVLMPVYNSEKYLKDAIESILSQTFGDFEFLIINDGSTDSSMQIVQSYNDKRIKLISNERNIGLPSTLNKGIELARGDYIVRMDSDDISLPIRIKRQVDFMDNNPEIGICGTWTKYIGVANYPWKSLITKYPANHRAIKAKLLFYSSICHASIIMRKSLLEKFKLRFDTEDYGAEDFGFWQKCIPHLLLANIPEVLYFYRVVPGSITQSKNQRGYETVLNIIKLNAQKLGVGFTPKEILVVRQYPISFTNESLIKFHSWLQDLQKANATKQVYPEPEFTQALSEQWFLACYLSSNLGIKIWFLFWRLSLNRVLKFDIKQMIKFILKCIMGSLCKPKGLPKSLEVV
jgi:glycosyltransferase involved in cell wall biosynthesis